MPKMARSHYDRVTAGLVVFRERYDLPTGVAEDLFRIMADALEGTSETYRRDKFLANCKAEGWRARLIRDAAERTSGQAPEAEAWEPRFMGRFTERRLPA